MTLRVESHADLGAVGREAWLRLEAQAPGATVFQSWWWLSAWWPIWGDGRALILTVHEQDRLVGAGAFFIGHDRRLGFIGEEHADYGNVLAVDDRADVIEALVAALFARRQQWARLALQDVAVHTPLARALAGAGCVQSAPVPCPRVRFAQRPVGELLAKESLRRHERKLAQLGALEFVHVDASGEIEPWLPVFFEQHIERWALTPTPSLFVRPRNREFYSELAATAEPGGSLLFTIVLAGGEPVAMHFGLRSQDELLWYKPTFDPRRAASGPGEVLLAELLRRAAREECAGVDFTRGDEAFKLRFATELREVASFEAWPDALSRELATLGRQVRAGAAGALDRLGLKQPVRTLSRKSGRAATIWRTHGTGAVIERARILWARPRASTLELYARVPGSAAPSAVRERTTGLDIAYCTSLDALLAVVDPAATDYQDLLRHAARRFASGDELIVGIVTDTLVGWGWLTRTAPLPVTELDAVLLFPAGTVLCYDFRVLPAWRRRGYYTMLVAALGVDNARFPVAIYARSDHAASRAGIGSAGFAHVGTMLRRGRRPTLRWLPHAPPLDLSLQARTADEEPKR